MTTYEEMLGPIKKKNEFSTARFSIIYGNAGCGKTVLATTAQEIGKCVLINFENRISHIDETENLRFVPTSPGEFREDKACDYEMFLNFLAFIEQEQIKFNYLIIDTIDEMFNKFHLGMLRKGEIQDKYYGRADVYPKMWEVFKRIKDLGINIIATSHQKSEGGFDLLLPDKLKFKINMTVDNIFYLKANEEGNRVLQLKTNSLIASKLTTSPNKYNNIQSEIINPTWKIVEDTIYGSNNS